jgi:hypothetical protein
MKNNYQDLITPIEMPNITVPITTGECFDDVATLSFKLLSYWFLEPNKVKILEAYKFGDLPFIICRYQNKKLAIRLDFIQDYSSTPDSIEESDVIEGAYTEALRIFAQEKNLLPIIAGIMCHTNQEGIDGDKRFIKVKLNDKDLWSTEPVLLLSERPPSQVRIKYPFLLKTKK